MADLQGNLLVAQSGGTAATVNASLMGAISEAGRHPEQIEEIYGCIEGLAGALQEELIDLQDEKRQTIEGLRFSPAAALGLGGRPIDFGPADAAKADVDRLFAVLQAHNIRYFLAIGGREAQQTALHLHEAARQRSYDLRVVGIPKAIENDLSHTDSSPGYGSAIKYGAATVLEVVQDLRVARDGSCCIIEFSGQTTGWIPAGAVLARRNSDDAPHVILVPEVEFNTGTFLKRVQSTVDALRYCVVVVGERLPATAGQLLPGAGGSAADQLAELIRTSLNLKTTTIKLGRAQCSAAHLASATDADNGFNLGVAAVRAAIEGLSGVMVTTTRQTAEDSSVKWGTSSQALGDVLQAVHGLPRDWLAEDGFLPNDKFVAFAQPLIEGELRPPFERGLPKVTLLEKSPVEKKLPPYV